MPFHSFINRNSGINLHVVARRLTDVSFVRVLIAAAILHVALALSLFAAGRAQLAPSVIDRDGIMPSFAFDSYEYQAKAKQLAEMLRQGSVTAWLGAPEPVHVKLVSIPFSVLGPILGYGPLSAEPFNLLCYVALLSVVFALGREIGGHRVGLLSAAIVALWPTFVLHSLQLLKDPLFISGALAVVFFVTIGLTRTFSRRDAIAIGALTALTTFVLFRIRFSVGILVIAVVGCGFFLLVIRQIAERRFLVTNMTAALPALLTALMIITISSSPRAIERTKQISSLQTSRPKAIAGAGVAIPTSTLYRTHAPERRDGLLPPVIVERADEAAIQVGDLRSRFSASYPESGSSIDSGTEIKGFAGLVAYLPRSIEIGLWAPFPNTWLSGGRRVGTAGRLLSGAETLAIYFCQMLAVCALILSRRRLPLWLLAIIIGFGVSALALVITNVGALYRFRYVFWTLLIVLGVTGLQSLLGKIRAQREKQSNLFSAREESAAIATNG